MMPMYLSNSLKMMSKAWPSNFSLAFSSITDLAFCKTGADNPLLGPFESFIVEPKSGSTILAATVRKSYSKISSTSCEMLWSSAALQS